jgi:hypothetical protein
MIEAPRVHPADIEAIALRVVEMLADPVQNTLPRSATTAPSPDGFYATAADIARRCGVSAAWVRANAAALGGVRIGNGSRPRHRFNVAVADERIAAMRSDVKPGPIQPAQPPRARRRQRSSEPDTPLLSIKGRAEPVQSAHNPKRRGAAVTAPGMATGGSS